MRNYLAITLMLLFCIGCGQTGALYLPTQAESNSSQSSSASSSTSSSAIATQVPKKIPTAEQMEPPSSPEAKP